ncbi:flagellar hook-associated protein FlgL [Sphingomonas sp. CCH9-E2]|uniref:flagellar hook-associated protein FlgL n=3 Tax=unclassified Sphingomonas TaxID=196159 RepID=UPI00082F51CF|nr:flagellar hook-associated protein FlgL [Sphingomonas sp. CCH9-E2]
MRVTTSQSFDRPSLLMTNLTSQADRLQAQVATGKKILAPSDSASGWQQLSGLKRAGADDSAYGANIRTAQALLAATDTALDQVETQLQRARSLAVQANSDTVNAEGRAAIKVEIEAILTDLIGVANSTDTRGQPLFGGTSGTAAFTVQGDGSVMWTGGGEPAAIPIGDGESIAATTSGARAFGGIAASGGTTDMFQILSAFAAALEPDGTAGGVGTAMGDLDAALDQLGATRASVGARAFRLDLEAERLDEAEITREAARTGIEDADTAESIAQLQKTLTILQATQASFTKLTSLSLFDYLR